MLNKLRNKIDIYDLAIFYLQIERLITSTEAILYKTEVEDLKREDFVASRLDSFQFKGEFLEIQKNIISLSKSMQSKNIIKVYLQEPYYKFLFINFIIELGYNTKLLNDFAFILVRDEDFADIVFKDSSAQKSYNLKMNLVSNHKSKDTLYPEFLSKFLSSKNIKFYNNFLDLLEEDKFSIPFAASKFIESFNIVDKIYFDKIFINSLTDLGENFIFSLKSV